ncbi:MAG TPA: trehalose-phosphatase [Terracidiphilus sp.]|nr:trehalose-phosphatase [Terracidiphilus sp.]
MQPKGVAKTRDESDGGMTPGVLHVLDEFFAAVTRAPLSILLLDYDGSMAPFRVDRFQARPFAGVRELLVRIQSLKRTRMALVTGRPAGEIRPLLALDLPVEVWGLHGAERLSVDGSPQLEQPSHAALKHLDDVRMQLRRDSFGGRFEEKANAAVMHWRGIPRKKTRAIERNTRALFEAAAQHDGLRLLEFESGLELRVGRDKGGAVEAILEETARHAPAAYLGDDITDESAFRAVNASGRPSLSVLMRRQRRQTSAKIWLRPPTGLRMFLKRWIAAQEE